MRYLKSPVPTMIAIRGSPLTCRDQVSGGTAAKQSCYSPAETLRPIRWAGGATTQSAAWTAGFTRPTPAGGARSALPAGRLGAGGLLGELAAERRQRHRDDVASIE